MVILRHFACVLSAAASAAVQAAAVQAAAVVAAAVVAAAVVAAAAVIAIAAAPLNIIGCSDENELNELHFVLKVRIEG